MTLNTIQFIIEEMRELKIYIKILICVSSVNDDGPQFKIVNIPIHKEYCSQCTVYLINKIILFLRQFLFLGFTSQGVYAF